MRKVNPYLKKMRVLVFLASSFLLLCLAIVISWAIHLNQIIDHSLKEKALTPTQDFYALGDQIFVTQKVNWKDFESELKQYKLHSTNQAKILEGEYRLISPDVCTELFSAPPPGALTQCIEFYFEKNWAFSEEKHYLIAFSESHEVLQILNLSNQQNQHVMELPPLLFAQFYGDKPVLKRKFELGEAPAICLNAVLAIEDPDFLEHGGFSIKSILRAVVRNLQQGRKAQGGSTITQQLVKNYFLNHQKTYTRKFKELIMAVLLETKTTKDEILEAYLNEIYMAQNGVFEVRGFGAASEHYFAKSIQDLNPAECSLLAAILNSPGSYNPFRRPEAALTRRERVLGKLKEANIIDEKEFQQWNQFPLPKESFVQALDPAPYFLEAVKEQLQKLDIQNDESLKIVTTLNLRSQANAKKAVQEGLDRLTSYYKKIKVRKQEGKELQAALMAVDHKNGYVTAIVGGSSFKTAPFNRALKAKRQVGSIMKPFVYLSALEGINPDTNSPYTPLTIIEDQKYQFKYEGQVWSPQNYDKKFRGPVPLFYALKSSLNAVTAKVAIDSGLSNIIDLAKRLGIKSEIQALPSMSLGAYELYMPEVLQSYASIANMGERTNLTYISAVYNSQNQILFTHNIQHEQVTSPQNMGVLIGMLKQGIENGTGQVVRKLGFQYPAAGKTGTTSDYRDAWFAGFTPFHTAVVWIGYDDNTAHGLTGASGAAPIWANYMQSFATQYPSWDFRWPEGTELYPLDRATQLRYSIPVEETQDQIELVLKEGQQP